MTSSTRTPRASLAFALALTLLAGAAGVATAQDGKLLEAAAITFHPDSVAALSARLPGIREVLDQVEVQSITYLSDGLKVKGYLVAPKRGEKLPCVIYNRGGNRDFGALSDRVAAVQLARIASWGYIVVASQYRGNAGGEGAEEFGGSDVNDVLNLVPLLKAHPRADAGRIGMYGWSRGGMMTYLALARTDAIAAAVVGAGLADAFDNVARRPEMERGVFAELVPGFAKDREAALASRSAVRWAGKLAQNTPILLLHGTADWRVHPGEALAMASRLLELKRPFRLVMLEGGDHGLVDHRAEVDRLARDWLDRYVRDRRPWPSLEPHGP
jgi:dipeptidyl aminopeptidase/acylaminoacyl peptidase